MCGIAGELSWRADGVSEQWVRTACRLMRHRGPDGEGFYHDAWVALGHRRLAVIDVAGGAQPLSYHQRRYWITYNGEIYNYRALRAELAQQGYGFETHSDTEVILAAYMAWGLDLFQRLNGIFAFALWDAQERCLLLARDHLGVKPLLYHADADTVCFASELKALLAHPAVTRQVHPDALRDYLAMGYVLSPKTMIRDVNKVPAGHYVLARDGQCSVRPYWRLDTIVQDPRLSFASEETCCDELDQRLRQTVEQQLVSDVPLGALLSGGVDSSTISYYAAAAKGTLHTFSTGFVEPTYSELPYAARAARHLGTTHHDHIVGAPSFAQVADLVWHYDEPIGDTSIIPTYYVAALARKHVTVVLSGDGGDELFAGYDTYIADRLQLYYARLPAAVRRRLASWSAAWTPAGGGKVSLSYQIKQFIAQASATAEHAHYGWRLLFDECDAQALTGLASPSDYAPFSVWADHYASVPAADALHRALYVDIKTWLVDDILTKVDRASMACGLEARVPLLAPDFVAFAMRLPAALKLNWLRRKYILKRTMCRRLPRAILSRRKRGFNAPVSIWMRTTLAKDIAALLQAGTSALVDVKHARVRQLWTEHATGRADHGFKLWALVSLLLWEQRVLN